MNEPEQCDLSLYSAWPQHAHYDACFIENPPQVDTCKLERKSVPAFASVVSEGETNDLRLLLNEMTTEMREQFLFFRQLREAAERVLPGDGTSSDDVDPKQARADVKAATDAMSLIIRTLEKIDALQRQLARDRDDAQEREGEAADYAQAVAFFLKRIEDLANDRAQRKVAEGMRQSEGTGGTLHTPAET